MSRSPGEPLNVQDCPYTQGIGLFTQVPSYHTIASASYPSGWSSAVFPTLIPVQQAIYSAHDVPFQPLSTEYRS